MASNTWNAKLNNKWYEQKRSARKKTFHYIKEFVTRNRVRTMMEIGGGQAFLAIDVERYIGIEMNDRIIPEAEQRHPNAEMIFGDFLELDLSGYVGKIDMLLAMAVVQHMPHYTEFFAKALSLQPRLIVATFFGPMGNPRNNIYLKDKYRDPALRDGVPAYSNYYSQALMSRHLDKLPETLGRYRWRRFLEKSNQPRRLETVLIIEPRYRESLA